MQGQGPHDIRGLIPYAGIDWLWWLGALAILVVAAMVIYALIKWSERIGRSSRPDEIVDPYEAIEKRIRSLEPRQPFDRSAQKEFYYELSFMLRELVELRSGISATDMTVQELQKRVAVDPVTSSNDDREWLGFLSHADLVKFADVEASLSEAMDAKKDAVGWFKRLRPLPQVNQDVRLG